MGIRSIDAVVYTLVFCDIWNYGLKQLLSKYIVGIQCKKYVGILGLNDSPNINLLQ